jgi:hypothetical protein
MPVPACCICASYISTSTDLIDEKSEKPKSQSQEYPCCSRLICHTCLEKRPQFSNYCPYCQYTGITAAKDSPSSYHSLNSSAVPTQSIPLTIPRQTSMPPPYSEKEPERAPDVLHFVDPAHDTISILSIRYNVPATILRQQNSIYSDHLLSARKTILISGEYYKGGVSLSPRPIEGEEEELRKAKIRKWMMACKVVE